MVRRKYYLTVKVLRAWRGSCVVVFCKKPKIKSTMRTSSSCSRCCLNTTVSRYFLLLIRFLFKPPKFLPSSRSLYSSDTFQVARRRAWRGKTSPIGGDFSRRSLQMAQRCFPKKTGWRTSPNGSFLHHPDPIDETLFNLSSNIFRLPTKR